jgi:VanZ family protein
MILSSIPGNSAISSNPIDKILHFAAYAVLSIPLYSVLSIQDKILLLKKYPGISTFLLTFLFGFLNEMYQLFIETRTFNKFDLLANVLGSILMILFIKFTAKIISDLKI